MTAALSQQLEAISEQLQEMSETLEGMVKDKDRERLADALAANAELLEIAESVRRRGITQTDFIQLASLKHRVTSLQIETTAKLAELAPDGVESMSRAKPREVLEGLYAKQRLEYWLGAPGSGRSRKRPEATCSPFSGSTISILRPPRP